MPQNILQQLWFRYRYGLNSAGELSILHSPNSLTFFGSKKAYESNLKEIYSAALGISVEEYSDWTGLFITDPFNTPEAVVEVYIDGVSSLGYAPDTYDRIKHRVTQRFTKGGNRLVSINLSDPDEKFTAYDDAYSTIRVPTVQKQIIQHLKPMVEEDTSTDPARSKIRRLINFFEAGQAYSSDYAVIFNIMLWFTLAFAFSLVAIVYALADMDPGRDSIIYRMTTTRIKKDN
ncbi:Renin receptor [Operophtera brumata]|uniref:Renin receptor n=1 Tax=Operophtera brumata TaxID=104452 RepID=A0A0L7LPD6_OPEBR|nr:Renin receptor [Operophtera brumata]